MDSVIECATHTIDIGIPQPFVERSNSKDNIDNDFSSGSGNTTNSSQQQVFCDLLPGFGV